MRFEQIIAAVARTVVNVRVVDAKVRTIFGVGSFANAMHPPTAMRMLLGLPSSYGCPDRPWHAVAASAASAAGTAQLAIAVDAASARRRGGGDPLGLKRGRCFACPEGTWRGSYLAGTTLA